MDPMTAMAVAQGGQAAFESIAGLGIGLLGALEQGKAKREYHERAAHQADIYPVTGQMPGLATPEYSPFKTMAKAWAAAQSKKSGGMGIAGLAGLAGGGGSPAAGASVAPAQTGAEAGNFPWAVYDQPQPAPQAYPSGAIPPAPQAYQSGAIPPAPQAYPQQQPYFPWDEYDRTAGPSRY